jgi:hypothetical protein
MEIFAREGYHAARIDAIAQALRGARAWPVTRSPAPPRAAPWLPTGLSTYPPPSTGCARPRSRRAFARLGVPGRHGSAPARPGWLATR